MTAHFLGLLCVACSDQETELGEAHVPPSYWQDMAPLFAQHCVPCHREGGIAPIPLDDYAQAKRFAPLIEHVTNARTMPPWGVTSDGTCGEFSDSLALTEEAIARIAAWAQAGAQEGAPQRIAAREVVGLGTATELTTPDFVPEAQGGTLAEHDEYRCFELDAPARELQFITGYEIVPGTPEIVHHVIVEIVDPAALAADGSGRSNDALMRALDDESPDREGWPCFAGAGDGVSLEATPVVWAPGQGVVRYPGNSGVALPPGRKLIAQLHYNLADPTTEGWSDHTTVRFELRSDVEDVGLFLLVDPFLESLERGVLRTLPAHEPSTIFSWTRSGADLGIVPELPLQLRGVMPHMHELGRKYRMTYSAGSDDAQCITDIQRWDFHWQRMYFFAEPLPFSAQSQLAVSCDYDTTSVTRPVEPGWSTQDEMCTTTLYFTLPRSAVGL